MLETVKLTLQIIMGTEGSCKKVMIKLSPSTPTKRENIIELLNQRIPLLFYADTQPPVITVIFIGASTRLSNFHRPFQM